MRVKMKLRKREQTQRELKVQAHKLTLKYFGLHCNYKYSHQYQRGKSLETKIETILIFSLMSKLFLGNYLIYWRDIY